MQNSSLGANENAIVQELTETRLPIVFYDVGTAGGNITKIRVNYRKGVERIVELDLTAEEKAGLDKSAGAVKGLIDACRKLEPKLG